MADSNAAKLDGDDSQAESRRHIASNCCLLRIKFPACCGSCAPRESHESRKSRDFVSRSPTVSVSSRCTRRLRWRGHACTMSLRVSAHKAQTPLPRRTPGAWGRSRAGAKKTDAARDMGSGHGFGRVGCCRRKFKASKEAVKTSAASTTEGLMAQVARMYGAHRARDHDRRRGRPSGACSNGPWAAPRGWTQCPHGVPRLVAEAGKAAAG